jgi:indole-3-acetate monooxygenase
MAAADNAVGTQRIDATRQLAPRIRAYAEEVERERRLPRSLVQEISEAGLFRLWLPTIIGGDALDPLSTMRVIEEAAQADGSVGWSVMVAAQAAWSNPHLDEEIAATVFNCDDVFAGTLGPARRLQSRAGTARRPDPRSPVAART